MSYTLEQMLKMWELGAAYGDVNSLPEAKEAQDEYLRSIKPYPKVDGHREHYVRYPIQKDGLWYAVDVLLPYGYRENPLSIGVKTEEECQRGCDIHNSFHGWTDAEVDRIISQSMGMKEGLS